MSSSRVSEIFTGRPAFNASATVTGMTVFIWMDEPKVPPTAIRRTSILLSGILKTCPRMMRTLWMDCVVHHSVNPPSGSGLQTAPFGSICMW